jgi:hypothetical protein
MAFSPFASHVVVSSVALTMPVPTATATALAGPAPARAADGGWIPAIGIAR